MTTSLLTKLNELANGDESKCIDRELVIKNTGKTRLVGHDILPQLIQDLNKEGMLANCDKLREIRITSKGKERINRSPEGNIYSILSVLVNYPSSTGLVSNQDLQNSLIDLTPEEINYAIQYLEENGLVTLIRTGLDRPYTFSTITLTSRGRYEYHRLSDGRGNNISTPVVEDRAPQIEKIPRKPTPAGSPFGFTDIDWEIVIQRINQQNKIYITFGHQFKSKHYVSQELVTNVQGMFQSALSEFQNQNPEFSNIEIVFKALSAGYGDHLFNEIARDIISSDICVIDASDRNPNVMIELGVALTWGIRVLIIKEKKSRRTPTDISGQTWAAYINSGEHYEDVDHFQKLVAMINYTVLKKRSLA